ncbi:TIGR02147 family protein [Oligoflexus tunisiensis]|uniref:TIGR02147 family protein n=1 Tax=Oligoflexus tunisiensis TaxID=708132 RepID=UPI00114C921B|nr:TIGR02147 family protein [Oligoflexus tunisiensis]
MNTENLTLIVLRAASSKEALQQVFAFRKALDSKFSLAYIARRLGLKSRGTLSLMLRGERAIPARMRRSLLQLLTQDDPLTDYLELLLTLEEATSASARQEVEGKLKALHYYLRDRFTSIQLQHGMNLLASDILCAFDLFAGCPTERQLIDFFGKARFREVQTAIGTLLLNGLIKRRDGVLQRTERTQRFLTIQGSEQDSMLTYLKESIHDAYQNVGKWQGDTTMSCFGSTTMSVRRQTYVEVIKRLKKDVFRYFSELETEEGDTLIRFNMQIFPLQPPG